MTQRQAQPSLSVEVASFRFWSDTNQKHFTDMLYQRGIAFELPDVWTVKVLDSNPTIKTIAHDLGADTF